MELQAGDSTLQYSVAEHTIFFKGSMRLANLMEYEKVGQFMKDAVAKGTGTFTLDLKELVFLNSSGITTLSMFIINMKKVRTQQVKVVGSSEVPWQEKSLRNFHKLWNEVEVVIV